MSQVLSADEIEVVVLYRGQNRITLQITNGSSIALTSFLARSTLFPDWQENQVYPEQTRSLELDNITTQEAVKISFKVEYLINSKPETLRFAKRMTLIKQEKVEKKSNRIAIIGAGLSGLTVAYRLSQQGYKPIVFEASRRIGGRCLTGTFPNGQIYEHGGELIDTRHTSILSLMEELDLSRDDLYKAQAPGTTERYHVLDYHVSPPVSVVYTFEEAANDYFNQIDPETGMSIYQRVCADAKETLPVNTEWPLQFPNLELTKELDSISLNTYIDRITAFLMAKEVAEKKGKKGPINSGWSPKLAQLIKVAYTQKFGLETTEQTPFNLIYLLGTYLEPASYSPPNVPVELFRLFGISDQRYHITGGTQRLIDALSERLFSAGVPIRLRTPLREMVRTSEGNYDLTFDVFIENTPENRGAFGLTIVPEGNSLEVPPFIKVKRTKTFERVILTLPFPVIRAAHGGVEISQAGFSDLKLYAIGHLEMSRNVKLQVQFRTKYWRHDGNNGITYDTTDPNTKGDGKDIREQGYQNTWEVSRGRPQNEGILVNLTGGRRASGRTSMFIPDVTERNHYLEETTATFLKSLDAVVPGAQRRTNFRFEKDDRGYIVNVVSDNWSENPWQRGSSSVWLQGQIQGGKGKIVEGRIEPKGGVVPFAGYEGVAEPFGSQNQNCHFAGEHTSVRYQGSLEGAVESAERVAQEIISAMTKE